MPALNQARSYHSSIILNNCLFVIGGYIEFHTLLGSIECLSLHGNSAFRTLIHGTLQVKRIQASVVAISAKKLFIFGGSSEEYKSAGYEFDITTNKVRRVPGNDDDFREICYGKA